MDRDETRKAACYEIYEDNIIFSSIRLANAVVETRISLPGRRRRRVVPLFRFI